MDVFAHPHSPPPQAREQQFLVPRMGITTTRTSFESTEYGKMTIRPQDELVFLSSRQLPDRWSVLS